MPVFRIPFIAFGRACETVLDTPDLASAKALADPGIREIRRMEEKFAHYGAGSIVSRINACAGQRSVVCDEETLGLLDIANSLHRASGGLFDATIGALHHGWDFERARLPSAEKLAHLLGLVGWERVELANKRAYLPQRGMALDLGAILIPLAADRAADISEAYGAWHGYVRVGGDVRVIGPRPDGSPWLVGIDDPACEHGLLASVPLLAGGLSSVDDRRGFVQDGQRYCDMFDPRTGWPVRRWRAIGVKGPNALTACAVAMIGMLKQVNGPAFLERAGLPWTGLDREGGRHPDQKKWRQSFSQFGNSASSIGLAM